MKEIETHEIPEYLDPYFAKRTQIQYYQEYARHSRMERDIEDAFICLKGFSSSTPYFRMSTFNGTSLGGGLYFRWKGLGIVVDPGIGFLTQMHDHRIFIDDVDVVIVTHAHIDHNQDARGLASLLYDYNKGSKRSVKFYSEFFPKVAAKEHNIQWILDAETCALLKKDVTEGSIMSLGRIYENAKPLALSENVELQVFCTEHVKNNSYGIKLYFRNKDKKYVWGYTSDTKFFKELSSHLENCDTLIMNISDVYPKDIEGVRFKNGHLGFNGCVNLLEKIRPSLVLISEFTCMNGDFRHEIVKGLCEKFEDREMRILPAEVGLAVKLSGDKIRCSYCGYYHQAGKTKSVRPSNDFERIHYVCERCLL